MSCVLLGSSVTSIYTFKAGQPNLTFPKFAHLILTGWPPHCPEEISWFYPILVSKFSPPLVTQSLLFFSWPNLNLFCPFCSTARQVKIPPCKTQGKASQDHQPLFSSHSRQGFLQNSRQVKTAPCKCTVFLSSATHCSELASSPTLHYFSSHWAFNLQTCPGSAFSPSLWLIEPPFFLDAMMLERDFSSSTSFTVRPQALPDQTTSGNHLPQLLAKISTLNHPTRWKLESVERLLEDDVAAGWCVSWLLAALPP